MEERQQKAAALMRPWIESSPQGERRTCTKCGTRWWDGPDNCLGCFPAPSRFETPGRKWLEPDAKRSLKEGGYWTNKGFTYNLKPGATAAARAYVHPRSLRGGVNVAPLACDDQTGEDVAS